MIVILSKSEIKAMRKLKLQGKSDQAIIFHIMKTAKFDLREAKDINEADYPKIDMAKVMAEVAEINPDEP